jgi:hypothetical protein
VSEQKWNSRPGMWREVVDLEKVMERNMGELERDLFEYAYKKGYDENRNRTLEHIRNSNLNIDEMQQLLGVLETIPQNLIGHYWTPEQAAAEREVRDSWSPWLQQLCGLIENIQTGKKPRTQESPGRSCLTCGHPTRSHIVHKNTGKKEKMCNDCADKGMYRKDTFDFVREENT